MKRDQFQAKAKAQVEVEAREPAPAFVSQVKLERQQILQLQRLLQYSGENTVHSKTLSMAMRANQILTAFYKGRSLSSVESGDIRNTNFLRAMNAAQLFMESGIAENRHVKAFNQWYHDNLILMGYGKDIVSHRKFFFVV